MDPFTPYLCALCVVLCASAWWAIAAHTSQPHGCKLRPDHHALCDAVHSLRGRVAMLEARLAAMEEDAHAQSTD